MLRIGFPSALLLAIRSYTDAVHDTTFDPFVKRTNSDRDYTKIVFLSPVHTAKDYVLIRNTNDPQQYRGNLRLFMVFRAIYKGLEVSILQLIG